jgi:XTP/dITP diphosphohydrolase
MTIKLFLASGNQHKAEEFAELFSPEILIVEAAPEKVEVTEDGLTYNENAFKKAQAYYEKFKVPVVSDDSGLNVQALPDDLGIHTARFGGDGLSASERNTLLLERMKDIKEREAEFVCVLCFYFSPDEVFFFEGRLKGEIGQEQLGDEGFGYDPVFMPSKAERGKSLAELPDWKQLNSHRALACQSALKFFKERVGQN